MAEIRLDPIVGRRVIFAPEREARPCVWRDTRPRPSEAVCPFCPGNESLTPPEILAERSPGGRTDGPGWSLRVVPNRFPALGDRRAQAPTDGGRFRSSPGVGAHEVIIESPVHERDLSDLDPAQAGRLLDVIHGRIAAHARDPRIRYVQVFKNHGPRAGASLAHGHAQLIATPYVPEFVEREIAESRARGESEGGCPYCALLEEERALGVRLVLEDDFMSVIAPFAARMPFETWILPRSHRASYTAATAAERVALAVNLRDALRRIRLALGSPDYNVLLHTSPCHEPDLPHYHWHVEILPRSLPFGGFEWGTGTYINPTLPEAAAATLRGLGA